MTTNSSWQLARQIFDELAATQSHQFIFISFKWAALGAFVGFWVGILAIVAFRKLGWYQSGWRFAGWVRWPIWILGVTACIGLIGSAGFFLGTIRGSEHVMLKSQLGTKVFPLVGDALADGIAGVQVYLANTNSASGSNLTVQVDGFHRGDWEVDAPKFLHQLDELSAGAASNLIVEVETRLVANRPQLQSGLPNTILHHTLRLLGTVIVEGKIHSQLKRSHLDDFYHGVRDHLVAEAREHGHPETINHPELSAFLIKEVIVPSVMKPIRMFAGSQANMFFLFAILSIVIPPTIFKFTCGRVKPPTPPEPPQLGAPQPPPLAPPIVDQR